MCLIILHSVLINLYWSLKVCETWKYHLQMLSCISCANCLTKKTSIWLSTTEWQKDLPLFGKAQLSVNDYVNNTVLCWFHEIPEFEMKQHSLVNIGDISPEEVVGEYRLLGKNCEKDEFWAFQRKRNIKYVFQKEVNCVQVQLKKWNGARVDVDQVGDYSAK